MSSDILRKYAPFWSKYRPAILKMMQAAETDSQQYQFMKHEVESIAKKPKGGLDFQLVTLGGKSVTNIRNSEIAQDLLNMLLLSQTGSSLLAANQYEFKLDKKLVLHISRHHVSTPVSTETEQNITN
jgi:hypothetical protein